MPPSHQNPVAGVAWDQPERESQALALAHTLGLPALGVLEPRQYPEDRLLLWASARGVALQMSGRQAPGPVMVDFQNGKAAFRRLHGGGRGQPVARAVGLNAGRQPPSILDATAGLGQDAFVLACLGCDIQLIERSPIVWALLEDGLRRASEDPELAPVVGRMQLRRGQAIDHFSEPGFKIDVVYLDPMFPHREKSAQVKKEMHLFRQLLGNDDDADALLEPALACARYRVVVKRPRLAPPLAGREPDHRLEGKSNRYDLYTLQRLP